MHLALLGPVEVIADGGGRIEVPSRRQRQLLVVLGLRREQTVSGDVIAELLWGDELPSDPAAALQTNISRLRRLLRPPIDVTTQPGGYRLTCPAWAIDVDQFEAYIDASRSAPPNERLALTTEALTLWHGEPFVDLDHPDIVAARQHLERLRLEAIEGRIDALCDLGRHDEAIADAELHVRDHPTRERPVAALMRSLYATGRHADALARFTRLREHLLGELGVDPSPELRDLELSVLQHEIALVDAAAPARPRSQRIGFCTAVDGVRLAFATSGDGPPLVKAATWMTHLDYDWDSPVWRHWIEGLSAEHRLVRYDERGCGLSDQHVDRFGFDAWVDDLAAVVDANGLDRFPLIGVSQGAAVAIAYAVRHPERVTKLVLYGAYGEGRFARARTEDERRHAALQVDLARLGWGSEDPAFRQVFTSQFMPDGTRKQWAAFDELQRRTTTAANAARFMEVFGTIDVMDDAARVRCPVLLLHARDERRVPITEAHRLAATIPDSRLVTLPGSNHLLQRDEPAWPMFLDAMHEFLDG
jgi:pimeloyl-ACP methyl ester carboxylesterase/DNA-binding SARP family transcriptional activator